MSPLRDGRVNDGATEVLAPTSEDMTNAHVKAAARIQCLRFHDGMLVDPC